MISESYISGIINEKLNGTSLYLVEVKVRSGNKIVVFIDGDNGVTIDDCVALSRYIEGNLNRDVEDFSLDVSSAGLDLPLRHIRQYKRFINKKLEVVKSDGVKITGTLISVSEEKIEIKPEIKKKKKDINTADTLVVTIPFESIKETKPVITF